MADLPPPGSIVERVTARVLPVNPAGQVLLLHGWEPRHPDRPFWFTIGGGVEEGEDSATAAARELREEVGISVDPASLRGPLGTWPNAFSWGEWEFRQQETWFAVAVGDVQAVLDGLDGLEQETIDCAQWWHPADLEADGTAVHADLPARMRMAVELVG